MKAPIRRLVEALDARLGFLPGESVRKGREYRWLHAEDVRGRMRHYGAWVNFWGISCLLITPAVPLAALAVYAARGDGDLSVLRCMLCFPAVMLGVKYAGDLFICTAANIVRRFAPGAGCTVQPQPWEFRELRDAYAWYCGVPRYWARRMNRGLFLLAALGVCLAYYLGA